jgi:TonB family protein
MPEAGETLQGKVIDGRFHLGRYLGGSERSAVFLTERPQGPPRTAAIKLMPADPATADLQLSRWKLISRLRHPHLLQIFEAGRWRQDGEEMLYVVMEYAEENLAQILPHRALTPDEAREMLKPTLDALAYLHGRGFMHGRLKPANIMVAGEQLKLASDGICRMGESDGAEAGTYGVPDSPGTAAGAARDVWSLGVTLVQVLTQLLPARGGSEQQRVTLPETLPPEFVDLAQNCLEPDPQRRCTLAEIAEHLHYKLPARTLGPPALPAAPAVAQRPRPVRSPAPPAKNRSALPLVAVLLTLAVIVGGVMVFRSQMEQPDAPLVAVEEGKPVQSAATAAPPGIGKKLPVAEPRKAQSPERATLKTASEVRDASPAPSLQPRANSSPGLTVPEKVVQQVLPEVPRSASNTIRGTVRVTVRARIDPAGNVAGVDMISAGPSRYFARLASDAVREWTFSPARRNGQAVASAWTVRFEFTRGGVRAVPVAVP